MTILVIGGCGFIGSHIVSELASNNYSVLVYDNQADDENNSDLTTYIKGSLSDLFTLESAIQYYKVTHVIHLVSTTLPKTSNEDMKFDLSSNVVQTLGLLDLCVKHGVYKIIFMSSGGTVYGVPQSLPINEDHPTEPICSYGICKLTIEKYLALYKHLFGLQYVIIRAANPYGPGQNPLAGQGIIATYVHRIQMALPLEVWGDGRVVRDYFDVRDLADLCRRALFSEHCGVFNAGSGNGTSVNDLVNILSDLMHIQPLVIYKESRNFDVPIIILDCSRAEQFFGWKAAINLIDGVFDYLKWYKSDQFHQLNMINKQ
jgi:UDP-glucose 4-epimerase